MSDTIAVSEDRYQIRRGQAFWFVVDRATEQTVGPRGTTWAFAHSEAQRLNRAYRAALNKLAGEPVAPRCDCPAERYRHALAQIGRYSSCAVAQHYVDKALTAADRAKGETQ